ncbi:diguanylate cyclase [Alkalibaculum sp. M08DMB]|uniref:Diguanylate cyclase n=1 Tax=Alkalibaculum sporogenes TaxID=2655001 RepID=A0A6A7K929_9FIRM|nr:diguanylate cyclase [Alkalibaculum sporogenes]MPW25697.1 diguanylate cyclase [Alkalibaculum sporogenes]
MASNIMIVNNYKEKLLIKDILEDRLKEIAIFNLEYLDNLISELIINNIQVCLLYINDKSDVKVLQEIKENPHVMDLPIIICSENLNVDIMEQTLTLGAYDYLVTPKDDEILEKLFCLKIQNAINHIKRYEEIIYLSYHDEMTGLYNKRFFKEEIRRLDTKRQLPISVVVGDVNSLKMTNDVFGHHIGDKIIVEVANVLKQFCRKEDIIARWGGDEFYILLPKTSRELAKSIYKRIQSSCLDHIFNNIPISVSLGYHTKENDDENIDSTIRRAEEWMYKHKLEQSKSFNAKMIKSFKDTITAKNPKYHLYNDAKYELVKKMGSKLSLTEDELVILKSLVMFADIGYITLQESIINKKEKLSTEEWDEIRKHTEIGYRIAKASPELNNIADYILYHHERWDGKGYPHGLRGERIPQLSRIISIVNAYDAMISVRPYRRAFNKEEAISKLLEGAGSQFDPYLVNVFLDTCAISENRAFTGT